MNTSRCTPRRPRSIGRIIADLQAAADDLYLIADRTRDRMRAQQVLPTVEVPRISGEDIHRLEAVLWQLATTGEMLDSLVEQRRRWRCGSPEERRELLATHDRHADQPTSGRVRNVAPLDPCDASQDVHDDTSAANR